MSPTFDALVRSWPFEPMLLAGLALTGAIYFRGWLALRWQSGRLCAFLGGLATIYLALASPIEPFAALLLQVHMLQHMLLMMAAPPLLWLGAPLFPLLRGLPRPVRTYWVSPLGALPGDPEGLCAADPPSRRRCPSSSSPPGSGICRPLTSWHWAPAAGIICSMPASSPRACCSGIPVVRPFPSRPRWSPWLLVPYLILADVQSTVLSALLTFSDRVLYPYYLQVPRVWGLSVLEDQAAAGVIMWVPGSLAFLLPLFGIGLGLLYGRESGSRSQDSGIRIQGSGLRNQASVGGRVSLPLINALDSRPLTPDSRHLTPGFDLLRLPAPGPIPEMAACQARHASASAPAGRQW